MKKYGLLVLLLWNVIITISAQIFELNQSIQTPSSEVITFLTLDKNNQFIYTGHQSGKINIYTFPEGQFKKTIYAHRKEITHIAFNSDNTQYATAGYDGKVKLWNVTHHELIHTFDNPSIGAYGNVQGNEPTFVVFSPDNQVIYFGGYNAKILKGSTTAKNTQIIYASQRGGITSGQITPDKANLAFSVLNKTYLLNLNTNQIIQQVANPKQVNEYICELAYARNKNLFSTYTYGGKVQFWNKSTNQLLQEIEVTNQKGSSHFNLDKTGNLLLTGNDGNKIQLWNITTQEKLQTLEGHTAKVKTMCFSEDGQWIITGGNDGKTILWKRRLDEEETTSDNTPNTYENRETIVQGNFKIRSRVIDIKIWDSMIEDGDTISLGLNGRWLLKEVALKKKKQKIRLQLQPGENYISLYAHNEGTRSPNTAAISIIDGNKVKTLQLNYSLAQNASIKLHQEITPNRRQTSSR